MFDIHFCTKLIDISLIQSIVDLCMTKYNNPCRFPFIYNGVTYRKCIIEDDYYNPWCATETNSTHHFINRWEDCSSTCPVQGGIDINCLLYYNKIASFFNR